MKKEFKLSEKRFTSKCGWDVVQTEDIKEFIRLLKEDIDILEDKWSWLIKPDYKKVHYRILTDLKEKIDKLTGDLK